MPCLGLSDLGLPVRGFAAAASGGVRYRPPQPPAAAEAVPDQFHGGQGGSPVAAQPCLDLPDLDVHAARPLGIRRSASHQLTRSNQRTGSAPINHSLPPRTTASGPPVRACFHHHVLHARHS